jgi:DNA-binding transcriptional LysR family regulator
VPGALTLDQTGLAVALARAGAGLAYLPEPCVTPLIREGALRCVLGDWSPAGAAFHLYYPGRRQLQTGLRLLTALIREMRPLGF